MRTLDTEREGSVFLVAAEEIFYCDNDDVTIGGMV